MQGAAIMAFKQGEVVCGKYEIMMRPLVGGQAYIYQAQNIETGEMVALKILKDEYAFQGDLQYEMKARFRLEASLHRLLSQHPNILTMLGTEFVELEDGMTQLVCVFEWIEGGLTLDLLLEQYIAERDERLARGVIKGKPGPFMPLPLVLNLMRQVAEAIAFAHSQDIAHRDLKPANVLLVQEPNGEWTAKVSDFGIAKNLDQESSGRKLTKTGTSLGTPDFMAPEQGLSRFDQPEVWAFDAWAFWAMVYLMLTGALPYDARGLGEWVEKWHGIRNKSLAYEPIDSLVEGVPEDLQLMIRAGLNPEPNQRPGMKETAKMLKQMCGDLDHARSKTELRVVVHSSKPPVFDPMAQTTDAETMARALPAAPPEKPKMVEASKAKVAKPVTAPATPQRVSKPVPGKKQGMVRTGNPLPKPTSQPIVVQDRVSSSPAPQEVRASVPSVAEIATRMASQPVLVFEEPASRTIENPAPMVIPPPVRQPSAPRPWLAVLILIGLVLLAATANRWLPAVKQRLSRQPLPVQVQPSAAPSGPAKVQVAPDQASASVPETAYAPLAPMPANTDWSRSQPAPANQPPRPVRPGPRPAGNRTEAPIIEGLPPGAPPPENQ